MVDYSSKKQPIPLLLTFFLLLLFLLCICYFGLQSGLDLDTLNGLFDVLQQRLVLRALILVLVSVHVCQCTHISVKVLFIHWLLWGERNPWRNRQSEGLLCAHRQSVHFLSDTVGKVWKTGGQRGRKGTPSGKHGSITQTHWNAPFLSHFNIMISICTSACEGLCNATPNHAKNQERDGQLVDRWKVNV